MSRVHQAHQNKYAVQAAQHRGWAHDSARTQGRQADAGTSPKSKGGDGLTTETAAELARQDLPFGPVADDQVAIDILHFNDMHRQLEPSRKSHLGGAPEMAGLIHQMKKEYPNAIVANMGDVAYGVGPIAGPKSFAPMPEIFNEMGVNLLELGNHELQDPTDNYKALHESLIGKLDAEVLCGNLTDKSGQPLDGVKPYTIKQMQGMNIAFIGILTRDLATSAHPTVGAGLTVANIDSALQKLVPEVRAKGADAVVVMAHESYNDCVKIAGRVGGVDATLAGHDHKVTPDAAMVKGPDGHETLVTEAGSHGAFLGHLRIVMDRKTHHVVRVEDRLIPVDGHVPPDPEVEAIVQAYEKGNQAA